VVLKVRRDAELLSRPPPLATRAPLHETDSSEPPGVSVTHPTRGLAERYVVAGSASGC